MHHSFPPTLGLQKIDGPSSIRAFRVNARELQRRSMHHSREGTESRVVLAIELQHFFFVHLEHGFARARASK